MADVEMSRSESAGVATDDAGATDETEVADDIVVQACGLKRYYPVTGGPLKRHISDVKAVDEVDLRIPRGQTLGLVGESGCGKSTLARLLVRLDEPTAGHIYFDIPSEESDEIAALEATPAAERTAEETERLSVLRERYDVQSMKGARKQEFRRNVQFVFQNPVSSLNPRQLIRDIVNRPLKLHTDLSADEREERIVSLLEEVGLGADFLYRYPHMLSGGQCQRVAIARAIATNPEFIVLDEPTSALDVSVQAQILNLLEDLQEKLGLTYLFITHDLGVIRHMADDIAVMYLGKMVELTSRKNLFSNPKHPYTEALISSSPAVSVDRRIRLEGDVPNPENPPLGCRFHTRCHKAEPGCGWNGADLASLLQNHAEDDETVGRVYEGTEVELDGFSATFSVEGDLEVEQAERVLSGAYEPLASEQPVLFEAITDVTTRGDAIEVTFQEVAPPTLQEDEPGHHVSCRLYD